MGSYDELTSVTMTIKGPAPDVLDVEDVDAVVRRFIRSDINHTISVQVAPVIGRYEATVTLWPAADPAGATDR